MAHDILKLLDQLAPGVRDAFLRSIIDIKSEAQQAAIIGALLRGDIDGALDLVNLRPELFGPLDEALRAAYLRGGAEALAGLPRLPDPFPRGVWWRGLMAAIHAPRTGSSGSPPASSSNWSRSNAGSSGSGWQTRWPAARGRDPRRSIWSDD